MRDKEKIIKKYEKWNELKQEINFNKKEKYPKKREIRYISMGKNIGFEVDGKGNFFIRAVLVLKQIGNLFLVVAMSSIEKNNKFYYKLDDKYFNKKSFIILSHFKTIDKKRFIKKIQELEKEDFEKIRKKIKKLF